MPAFFKEVPRKVKNDGSLREIVSGLIARKKIQHNPRKRVAGIGLKSSKGIKTEKNTDRIQLARTSLADNLYSSESVVKNASEIILTTLTKKNKNKLCSNKPTNNCNKTYLSLEIRINYERL